MASGQRINTDNIGALASGKKLTEDDAKQAIPFKICLVGNAAVGKSCIVDRYINDNFAINSAGGSTNRFSKQELPFFGGVASGRHAGNINDSVKTGQINDSEELKSGASNQANINSKGQEMLVNITRPSGHTSMVIDYS